MQSLTHRGLVYRTKLLTTDQAWRFATCLKANSRFTDVLMVHSSRATGPRRYYVAYRPSNPDRQAELTAHQQQSREERALAEGSGYTWVRDGNAARPFFWCLSTSGEVYEVDPKGGTCSCPDFECRCRRAGISCKHLLALQNGLGTVGDFQPIPTPADRRAAARADIASLGL